MKQIEIKKTGIKAPSIGLGCMRIDQLSISEIETLIQTSMEQGINFFEHADIYGGGICEEKFGQAIEKSNIDRESMLIQTKCGIRKGFFDFSKEHIINSVEGSLKRLNTEYVDFLLLHRPDALMEPEEVAEAFTKLKNEGKVKCFGVSNQNPMQIELLNKYLTEELAINQLQFSLMHTGMIDSGFNVNMKVDSSIDRDGSILEYCRLKDMTIQAWSPFQYGFFEGVFLNNDKFPELNQKINEMAESMGVSNSAIAIAWILRHPAEVQAIVGTTNKKRLEQICEAGNITLTREQWYELYRVAGNILP